MIKKELHMIRLDGVALYRTYSDSAMNVRQIETGNIYTEAIDVEDAEYTYEEVEREPVLGESSVNTRYERKVSR